jgi:hypothetical protein
MLTITKVHEQKYNKVYGHVEQSKTMRAILNKERSTRLEGEFWQRKNHYQLQKK